MASLYRKWRSRSFDDLIGQDHVVRTLRNAVKSGHVAHAYLFTGPRGTGKTSTARLLAKAVNCLQPRDGNPCNECAHCVAANEGRAVDVIEIDAASNTSVENVRDLRERVAYAAGEGRYKVYIVDEVHRLSGAAFDAFLKTLEEPPPHVIFVFASTEPHKVPATITSRCQRFDFRRIGPDDTLRRVSHVAAEEGFGISPDALRLVAQHGNGSLRDALGLLEQVAAYTGGQVSAEDVRTVLGLADATLVQVLTDHLLSGATGDGLREMNKFVREGGDPAQMSQQLVDYWRALLLEVSGAGTAVDGVDPALLPHLERHASGLQPAQVLAVIAALVDTGFSPRFNVPAELPHEMAYVRASLAMRASSGAGVQSLAQVPAAQIAPSGAGPAMPSGENGLRPSQSPSSASPPIEPRVVAGSLEPRAPAATPTPSAPQPPIPDTGGTAAASPPGTSSGVVSGGDAGDDAWSKIVAGMRAKSPSLQAVLRSGHLMGTQDGEITIGFMYDFHRNVFTDVKKRRLLEEVVSDVMGAAYRVNCVRTTREEIQAARGTEALADDDGFIEEVAERLRQYHAKQLGNSA